MSATQPMAVRCPDDSVSDEVVSLASVASEIFEIGLHMIYQKMQVSYTPPPFFLISS